MQQADYQDNVSEALNKQSALQKTADNESAKARADAPSWGRASASAGSITYAGNHWGVPSTISLSSPKKKKKSANAPHGQRCCCEGRP